MDPGAADGHGPDRLQNPLRYWSTTTIAAGWRAYGVVFWSSDGIRPENRLRSRASIFEYAFTEDHDVQGELCSVVKF